MCQSYGRRLHGPNVTPKGSKMDYAQMVIEDIRQFREKTGAARPDKNQLYLWLPGEKRINAALRPINLSRSA
jgi:hypothetical protein